MLQVAKRTPAEYTMRPANAVRFSVNHLRRETGAPLKKGRQVVVATRICQLAKTDNNAWSPGSPQPPADAHRPESGEHQLARGVYISPGGRKEEFACSPPGGLHANFHPRWIALGRACSVLFLFQLHVVLLVKDRGHDKELAAVYHGELQLCSNGLR